MQLKRRPRTSGGFTLPEVVCTVTIMGLIVVPLCTALMQAVTLPLQSSATALTSVARNATVQQFVEDVGNANPAANSGNGIVPNATINKTCKTGGPTTVVSMYWNDGVARSATYLLLFNWFPPSPAPAGMSYVSLYRNDEANNTILLLSGWCTVGAPVVDLSVGSASGCAPYANTQVTMTLTMSDSPRLPSQSIVLEGVTRVTSTTCS